MTDPKMVRCPDCGGDGWLWAGPAITCETETCRNCMGKGRVLRNSDWWDRTVSLVSGLLLGTALLAALIWWGAFS